MDLFENFDFDLLGSPFFKEDSIREEIVVPIFNKLGYSASGPNKILRSKKLDLVYFGVSARKLTIIPDYTLQVNEVNRFILDAKSPEENILSGKNVEQAYSYAYHREIQTKFFALCNGRQLVVFDIHQINPILQIDIKDINKKWGEVYKILSPLAFTHSHIFNFQPDFGLHLYRMGIEKTFDIHFPGFWATAMARLETNKYTIMSSFPIEETVFCSSFDFTDSLYSNFLEVLPEGKRQKIDTALNNYPFKIEFPSKDESVNISVKARLYGEFVSGKTELFVPFIISEFFTKYK